MILRGFVGNGMLAASGRVPHNFLTKHGYNTERPHSSLGYLTPVQFARVHDAKQQFLTSDSNYSSD